MLHLHRAERADQLVDGLATVLATPLHDAFEPETVAVPTRGVERWLAQRLSLSLGASGGRTDGVCANVDFPFPGRLVGGATATATGVDRENDPWLPERSVWPLLDVVEDCLDEQWLAALAAHLGGADADAGDHRRARRFAAVRHLADLFDRYAVHRPAMIRAWADGDDTDGTGAPLPDDVVWQARLWRCLRERIATPGSAERLAVACERLRADRDVVDLPERLSLFGMTRLPASYLDVLQALAVARDVHLFLLHPSPTLWQRVAATIDGPRGLLPRRADPTAAMPRNPLLGTWGRDAREMQLVLAGDRAEQHHHPLREERATLLARIQADVRADRCPPGAPLPDATDTRQPLDPHDRSIQVHACHGRARQVEVLRDAISHLLADDPTLQPRDVIVMCPDIDAFAPLIHATFGAGGHDDDHDTPAPDTPAPDSRPRLPVRLADRSLRQTNPVLAVVTELLSMATARVTASQVLDFASREPVRRRFRLSDDDLARVEEWVAATGIRWGLDAAHRAPFHLDTLDANTWRAGLDRILLGVAMAEDDQRLVGGTLPLDDVHSGDIDLAGRLAELVDRLHTALGALATPKPVEGWAHSLTEAADALTATGEHDSWQRAQLQRLLDDVVAEATTGATPSPAPLMLAEIDALLADRLRGRPTRANFRTGHLTMCTLVPMRSVPHRVVCLLGLDDEVFPRKTTPDGDDLVQRDPCVGDRDPRSEDRQLLLDALLAATDHLVVTYRGRDERTNAPRPPAVPVGELLDVVDATARAATADGAARPARAQVLVHHPLQPFAGRNFLPGELVPDGPWSFDATAREGARAAAGPRRHAPVFPTDPLPPVDGDLVELDDVVAFVRHPVRAFLRQRLGLVVRDGEQEPADALPVELDKLEEWSVGQRLLEARLAGADARACRAAEVARGVLPPGPLGAPIIDRIGPAVDRVVAEANALVDGDVDPESVEVSVDLGGGRWLVGTVPDVVGDLLRPVTYSRVAATHRLATWVRLLALTAAHPERAFHAATLGRGSSGDRVGVAHIPTLGASAPTRRRVARDHLRLLVDLHDRGLCEPLPLYAKTSAAYAQARVRGRNAEFHARNEWTSDWVNGRWWSREDADAEHQLVLGGRVTFEDLRRADARDDEHGDGWTDDEPTRFGRYARRLWDGLLACEQVDNR